PRAGAAPGARREGHGREGEWQMSEPLDPKDKPPPPGTSDERDPEKSEPVLDDLDVRELMRQALRPPPGAVAPSLLRGVQRRLRTRSRGKFYGDGWSTARSPRSTYLVTSLLMLALIALVFLVLIPWSTQMLP